MPPGKNLKNLRNKLFKKDDDEWNVYRIWNNIMKYYQCYIPFEDFLQWDLTTLDSLLDEMEKSSKKRQRGMKGGKGKR